MFHGPDRESFLGALCDPAYRPDQRLLAKVDGRVVSHVHLTERQVRYGSVSIPINGVMWVGTLPEFRGMGFAQNLMRLASQRAARERCRAPGLTTGMPQFYRPLGWGVCGRQTFAQTMSRNLPQVSDGVMEARGAFWHVRPWRQVELGDLMALYDLQYARTTGTVVRSEEYWRWMIGRKYAHVIWVACQGETVRGYAFIKDHKVLEIAYDPAYPQALQALLGRVRAEALERAYPEVTVYAPSDHPVIDVIRASSGPDHRSGCVRRDGLDVSHPRTSAGSSKPSCRNWPAGRRVGGQPCRWSWGSAVGRRPLADPCRRPRFARRAGEAQPEAPDADPVRRWSGSALGTTGVAAASEEEGFVASTSTALDAARILFPQEPIWRSPLDSATA